jgi:hypothetical protein
MKVLNKESAESEIKAYFMRVLRLRQAGDEFPVALDAFWPLIYSTKGNATRELKTNFIHNVDYVVLIKKEKQEVHCGAGLNEMVYLLSIPCMEYFITRKSRYALSVYMDVLYNGAEKKQPKPKPPIDPKLAAYLTDLSKSSGVSIEQIKSDSRNENVRITRQMFCYEARKTGAWTDEQIGAAIGRDRSTVIYSCKVVETMLDVKETKYMALGGKAGLF